METIEFNGITFYKTQYTHYYVSRCGKVLSNKPRGGSTTSTNKIITGHTKPIEQYLILDITQDNIRRQVSVHRLVLETFSHTTGQVVDHIDGNRQNNDISNLRWSTILDNARNKVQHRNGKRVGSSYDSNRNKWRAQICINYRTINLGYFNTEDEAINAYNIADNKRRNV